MFIIGCLSTKKGQNVIYNGYCNFIKFFIAKSSYKISARIHPTLSDPLNNAYGEGLF